MHRRKPRFILIAAICTLALSACFSPWTGEDGLGEVRIGPGGGTARTIVPGDPERAEMTYEVHFSGPGGSFDRKFGPAGGVERLSPGSWRLSVKAYNNEPRLRGITDTTITISGGESHTVMLESCIGIKTEAELQAALGNVGLGTFGHDTTSGKGDLLVLEEDTITLTNPGIWTSLSMYTGGPFTIIAEPGETRTIARSTSETITVPLGGDLTLGRARETGTLIVDSNNATPAAIYASGGTRRTAGNTHFARLPITVTFHNNDTTSGFTSQPIGSSPPVPPSYAGHYFVGWYTQPTGGTQIDWSTYGPSEDVDLYAHWIKDTIANAAEWKEAITAVNGYPGTYSFAITGSFGLDAAGAGTANNPEPVSGVTLTLTQTGNQTITLNNGQQGSLLRVANGVTLTLNGPTLAGKADNTNNNAALVNVIGTFTLQSGTIKNNKNPSGTGGGVSTIGTFTMNGGSIEGCSATSGGGVYVGGGGATAFRMTGGTIGGAAPGAGNTATNGGGVYIISGTLSMPSGSGSISYNTASVQGGGIYYNSTSPSTLTAGFISNNEATGDTGSGGGIYIAAGSVTLSGTASISGNKALASQGNFSGYGGGGVYVKNAAFIMTNGSIEKNEALNAWGGGVYLVSNGSIAGFTMSGGTIGGAAPSDGNKACNGGGVCIDRETTSGSATFAMSGNTVIENNRAEGTSGPSRYGLGGGVYAYCNTTQNLDVTMTDTASIRNNSADVGTGSGGTGGKGGGVFLYSYTMYAATLTINSNSALITGNNVAASGDSGGVYLDGGVLSFASPAEDGIGANGTVKNNKTGGTDTGGNNVYYTRGRIMGNTPNGGSYPYPTGSGSVW